MFDRIVAMFPTAARAGTVFTWGETVFNPSGRPIAPEILEHEAVHARQQGGDPASWWERYLADAQFRFEQELEAHRVEYRAVCAQSKDRNARAAALQFIGSRLASPLYGGVVTRSEAMRAITA